MSKKVVIVGGGWAGTAAALAARQAGCDVRLFERTDMLLGTGVVEGGIRVNGRFAVVGELVAMGGGTLFQVIDRHCQVELTGHDLATIEPVVRRSLLLAGVVVHLQARVDTAQVTQETVTGISATVAEGSTRIEAAGDAFVDASGTAGPEGNCSTLGMDCGRCITRCPTFGAPLGIPALAGLDEREDILPCGDTLRVAGLSNVFCAGDKAGFLRGQSEAILTGTLAGHNAARLAWGLDPVALPRTLACGEGIAWGLEHKGALGEVGETYTFSGWELFGHMRERSLDGTDAAEIAGRVEAAGMTGFFVRKLG
ncbi:FAD-dependent oxidoreductase [Geomonas sp. Red32]|uniref:FAD-dependent oxidoreductase n=1 Tax=Geomonas sp. Red32 TaxID=2912856 RepID=UPI00202CF1CF|nr:FAD-dependent oxidoreductase [Geomonas sp. Red32]MCM0083010.1 FAD-dependent oxidoreductase [Geomonas sp. Red32]